MNLKLTLLSTLFSVGASAQKVEYRNDSLFLNNYYVDALTSKVTLDSLLKIVGKLKKSTDKYKNNFATGKKVKLTTVYYYTRGLYFCKYDYDTTKISIGIKLFINTDKKEDREIKLSEPFVGQLIIADNIMNDKRKVEQLNNLKNCSVTINKVNLGSYSRILGGDLIYQQNVIRLSFYKNTKELTAVFIHHNFKDR